MSNHMTAAQARQAELDGYARLQEQQLRQSANTIAAQLDTRLRVWEERHARHRIEVGRKKWDEWMHSMQEGFRDEASDEFQTANTRPTFESIASPDGKLDPGTIAKMKAACTYAPATTPTGPFQLGGRSGDELREPELARGQVGT